MAKKEYGRMESTPQRPNVKAAEAKNAFVKRQEDGMLTMMGVRPTVPAKMERFDAYMSNNGDSAQSFCDKLTAGIDKKAFPVC